MRRKRFCLRRRTSEFARTCCHESFLCAWFDGIGRGAGWGLDTFLLFLKLNTSWRWLFSRPDRFDPLPHPPQERACVVVWTGGCEEHTVCLDSWKKRTLASAGSRTKILLTSCPQCIQYSHYSLPASYREYLTRFLFVLSFKLHQLQEFLLHLLDILVLSFL
jgi:hypothetical protein